MERSLMRLDVARCVALALVALTLASWIALIAMAEPPPAALRDMPPDFWEAICIAAAEAQFGALFFMWALMATAMMLPSFAPAMRTFGDLASAGAGGGRELAALAAGYLVIWLLIAGLGAGAQRALSLAGYLTPWGQSASTPLSAALLIMAGLYQLSSLKDACAERCRSPFAYFMERWRPGAPAAFRMGLELGVVCALCCWALMALAFVGGVMNLVWMAAATLFMTLEKLPEIGRPLTRPAGWALLAAGALLLLGASPL